MTGAYAASLLFAWVAGYTAATRPGAARVILPLLDVGQSVPVLGFFPAAIYLFITLLGGGRLSLELAAIFLIFTSQVWNLAFAVYEGLSRPPRPALLGTGGARRAAAARSRSGCVAPSNVCVVQRVVLIVRSSLAAGQFDLPGPGACCRASAAATCARGRRALRWWRSWSRSSCWWRPLRA
jgi:hypothetical protein